MNRTFSRRSFLQTGLVLAAGTPAAMKYASGALLAAETPAKARSDAKVAIVRCQTYGPPVREVMDKCFDLLGGIGSLVKNKTVTVKLNLTGTDFTPWLGRPVGETFMTHYDTALALGTL